MEEGAVGGRDAAACLLSCALLGQAARGLGVARSAPLLVVGRGDHRLSVLCLRVAVTWGLQCGGLGVPAGTRGHKETGSIPTGSLLHGSTVFLRLSPGCPRQVGGCSQCAFVLPLSVEISGWLPLLS